MKSFQTPCMVKGWVGWDRMKIIRAINHPSYVDLHQFPFFTQTYPRYANIHWFPFFTWYWLPLITPLWPRPYSLLIWHQLKLMYSFLLIHLHSPWHLENNGHTFSNMHDFEREITDHIISINLFPCMSHV